MEMDTDAVVAASVNINWSQMNSLKFMGMATASNLSIRIAMYPFTLVRTRLQNQDTGLLHTPYKIQTDNLNNSNQGTGQQIKTPKVKGYTGMRDAFRKIYQNNGYRGLYDGFSVNCFSVFQHVMYIGVLEYTREAVETYFEGSKNFSQNTIKHKIAPMIGAICGTSTFIVSVPTDVVSQFLQEAKSDGSKRTNIALVSKMRQLPPNKSIVVFVIKNLWKTGGPRAFFKGFGVTCTLSFTNGVFWPLYFSFKDFIFKKLSINPYHDGQWIFSLIQSLSAAMACCISVFASNPIELTRNQSQMHQESAMKMFRKLWRRERMNMFKKGLTPRLVPALCVYVIGIPLYERIKKWSVEKKNESL